MVLTLFVQELSPELQQQVDNVFAIFDKDGSKTIEKDEAIKHWTKGFGKISAQEFFNTVDYNHDGQIQYEEFSDFWKIVKGAGHTEEEIAEEVRYSYIYYLSIYLYDNCLFIDAPVQLDRIKNGEAWIGFDNLPSQYMGLDKR